MRTLSAVTVSLTAAISAGALALQAFAPDTLGWACREDVLVEPAQAALYAISAAVFVYASRGSRLRRTWMLGLAAVTFWAAGEEVSWGQRMFGLATPAWLAARNVQGEITLHNVKGLHEHVRAAGLLFVGVLAFAVPLGYRLRRVRALVDRLELPVFPLFAAPTVAAGAAFMAVPRMRGTIAFELDEIGELLLALAFAAFACACAIRLREASAASAARGVAPGAVEVVPD